MQSDVTPTKFFFALTPELVLESVESAGFLCTGRCFPLNSFENRVYEVEIETDDDDNKDDLHAFYRKKVAKFYRPGRWSRGQIEEEHLFLFDLQEHEIPVITPERFQDGKSLHLTHKGDLFFAIFPKYGGRSPDELRAEEYQQLGRLLGRMHLVGQTSPFQARPRLTPTTYGRENLEYLLCSDLIPRDFSSRYQTALLKIIQIAEPLFEDVEFLRIHGDCHFGNILWNQGSPFFLDFDDSLMGPAIQDFWLLMAGRDEWASQNLKNLILGYEQMRPFPYQEKNLIEILRALRFVRYTAWVARRWSDPIFPPSFPEFGTWQYWNDRTREMEEQLALVQRALT